MDVPIATMVLTRKVRRIGQCSSDIFSLQRWIALKDFVDIHAGGEIVKHYRHRNASALNARLSVADGGINRNAFSPIHHNVLLVSTTP